MKDIAIDLNTTHDLDIVNNDLYLVTDLEYLLQKISIRLQFFFGEWFLDTSLGVPFYSVMSSKKPDIPELDAMIKRTILATDGVLELLSYSSSFDNSARTFSVETQIKTIYGETTITETLI